MQHQKNVCKMVGLLTLGAVSATMPAQAATYNVSTTGASSFNVANPSAPLLWEVARAQAVADPNSNDTIIFAPGVYTRNNVGQTYRDDCLLDVPTNVTVKASSTASGSRSILRGAMVSRSGSMVQSPQYQFITVGTNNTNLKQNIVIDGFEIENSALNGSNNEVSAVSLQNDCRNIQVTNNLIHDLGGGGIYSFNWNSAQSAPGLGAAGGVDYITIRGNRIYNCCRWFNGGGGGSGISLLGLSNTGPIYEDGRTVHNFIQRNRVYDCRTSLTGTEAAKITNNNGIIIDLAGGFDPNSTPNRSPAQTLIENNVVYRNDGRGIHVFKSSNVLVHNNTCYQNLQLAKFTGEGELSASFAKDVLFVNNVAYADGTNHPINSLYTDGFGTGNGNVIFRYNATGNGTNIYSTGVTQYGNIGGVNDACFNNPAGGDFIARVLPDYTVAAQIIVDRGSGATSSFPNNDDFAPNDYYGSSRPIGVQVDRGAFETSVETGIKAPQARISSAGSG